MGYFDGLTDGSFKTDDEGRLLFYRWSVFFGIIWRGKGYILPDEVKKQQIRRFVKLFQMVCLPVIIAGVIIVGFYSFFLLPLFFLWYFFVTARLLKGLDVTSEKLTLRESYSSSAKSHNFVTLWIMLISSIFFVLLVGFGLVLHVYDSWLIGLAIIIFFGAVAIVIGYMITLKERG